MVRPAVLVLLALGLLPSVPPAAAGEKVWVDGWRQTEALQVPRAGAAVVTADDYVYVIGGIDGRDFLASVEYSRFLPDGSLAPWHAATPLNEPRGFFGAVAHGGYLYAVGGANGPSGKHLLRSVERAALRSDGSLGPWEILPMPLNLPRRCVKLALVDGIVHALGGFGGTLLDSVESAPLGADGGLGPWQLDQARLTMPRYVNTVKYHGDTVYVIGGHNETEGNGLAAVEYARPDGHGGLGPWRRTAPLNKGRYALASAVHGARLYALGGLDGAIYSDAVEVSTIGADGGLGPWRTTTALSSPRANFGVVVHRDRIYIIGGTNRNGYYRSVEYATFDTRGKIGIRADMWEAAAYEAERKARALRQRPPLPNTGTVTQVIHTRSYSYLEVEAGGRRSWLAAPRGDFAVGQHIRYSRGVDMRNFHSRALGRDFAEILFVERVEVQGGHGAGLSPDRPGS